MRRVGGRRKARRQGQAQPHLLAAAVPQEGGIAIRRRRNSPEGSGRLVDDLQMQKSGRDRAGSKVEVI